MNIYEQLESLGVPLESNESDLYALVTPVSICVMRAYELRAEVRTFTSSADGRLWFVIPAGFRPFWDERRPSEHVQDSTALAS